MRRELRDLKKSCVQAEGPSNESHPDYRNQSCLREAHQDEVLFFFSSLANKLLYSGDLTGSRVSLRDPLYYEGMYCQENQLALLIYI